MNLDIESSALPTDMRLSSPIILSPAPTAQASPPNFTPSPHITVNVPDSTARVPRPILNPVPPSKRATDKDADRVSHLPNDSSPDFSAYLPREIREIVEQRQRRERAWHVRLGICTSVICNIDSTLAAYKDEVEKEEANLIRNYLQQAIARLAASEFIPKPPAIPLQSKPSRADGLFQRTETTKKKGSENIPIPSSYCKIPLPQKITTEEPPRAKNTQLNSWVTVARNGHKKSRVSASIETATSNITTSNARKPASPPSSNRNTNKNKKNIPIKVDNRLFIRISPEHEWRKLSPAGIREIIVKKLLVSPASIGLIKPVNSGFALSPCSTEAREQLLKAAGGLFLSKAKLEPATQWVPLLIPTVPRSIYTMDGNKEVTNQMLADEIERITSVRPEALKIYGNQKPEAPYRTWLALFTKAPRPGFRVFDESGLSSIFKKQKPIEFCKRCNGHHAAKSCSRAPSCGNCGSTMHIEDKCMAATKCRNCGGPHRSESRKCLARPTRHGAPTREQLKIYRQAGDREFQAAIRARAAEQKASELEAAFLETEKAGDTEIITDEDVEVGNATVTR
ncbi:hypothetical protein K3495_g2710, partial [Podosphaera aphanis]